MKSQLVAWIQRLTVAVLVAGALLAIAVTVPEMARIPGDVQRRFEATWLNLIFSAYAAVLAGFVVWKVGGRPEGRYLSLLLACIAVVMGIKTVPGGQVEPWRIVVFAVCWVGAFVQGLRFWSTFPQQMKLEEVAGLARRPGVSPLQWANRVSARMVQVVLGSFGGKVAFGAAAVAFAALMGFPGPTMWWSPNELVATTGLWGLDTGALVVSVPLTLAALSAIGVSAAFAYTGYRLADREHRTQVLWIVTAQLAITLWSVMAALVRPLSQVAPSGPILALAWFFGLTTHGVVWFVNISGFALAIFHSGAFDLRPVINKTTLYGASLVLLTLVFAGVEELVQSQVLTRFDLPNGIGTWMGATVVALVMGPIHHRLQGVVRQIGATLDPPESDAR